MAVDIYGKLHPGGQYNIMKSWLNGLSMEIPAMPEGDILTAIDNDQVLSKKWTVHKDKHLDMCVLNTCIQRLVPMMHSLFCKEMRSLHQGNANATIYNL